MLGSFLLLYCILALYGTALLYIDVRRNGCDPSGISSKVETCTSDGAGVFGAMLGMTTIFFIWLIPFEFKILLDCIYVAGLICIFVISKELHFQHKVRVNLVVSRRLLLKPESRLTLLYR